MPVSTIPDRNSPATSTSKGLMPATEMAKTSAVTLAQMQLLGNGALSTLVAARQGEFTSTGSLLRKRETCRSSVLADGRIMVTGGWNPAENSGVAWTDVEIYDPSTGQWTVQANGLNTGRAYHTQTTMRNGHVLVVGGQNVDQAAPIASAEDWDPTTGIWTLVGVGTLPAVCMHAAIAVPVNGGNPYGRVLILGGSTTGPTAVATCWLYDPVAKTFSATGSMHVARVKHSAILYSDGARVFVVGGAGISSEVYCLDGVNVGTWLTDANIPTARTEPSLALAGGGKILIAGGWSGGSYTPILTAYLYTEYTSAVAQTTNNLATFAGYGAKSLTLSDGTGRIVIAGGYSGGSGVNGSMQTMMQVYYPANQAFIATMPHRPWTSGIIEELPNHQVLMAAGSDVAEWLNTARLFTP